jgi:hypothetical protein
LFFFFGIRLLKTVFPKGLYHYYYKDISPLFAMMMMAYYYYNARQKGITDLFISFYFYASRPLSELCSFVGRFAPFVAPF